ncbi:MAG: hypothetical protein EB020_04435 [Proteobacteria bacterium]|nr:hypothetical protein [Pseudomonadota bacterium]
MHPKYSLFAAALSLTLGLRAQLPSPKVDTADRLVLNEVSLIASRPSERSPMPQLRLKPADLAKQNVGRDIPFLLQGMPSFTAASDAGNGFGYTYLRFRGMDQTRINVTVNNVALNDPESHGVFWVNTPDLGLNANSLVVQRGVGTSTLGSGAFGASLSFEVGVPNDSASQELTATYGSFQSARLSYAFHSGLMGAKKRWSTTGRVTAMGSQGFVDCVVSIRCVILAVIAEIILILAHSFTSSFRSLANQHAISTALNRSGAFLPVPALM